MKPAIKSSSLFQVNKDMKRHLVVIGAAALIILAVILLTIYLYHGDKAGILSQFEDHQVAHTQHLTHQIQFFLQARSQELQALSLFASREDGVFKKRKADMENYTKMMEYVQAVVVYNGTGEITYATGGSAIRLDGRDKEFLSWAKRRENRGKVLGLPLVQPGSFVFLLAVPLYQGSLETRLQKSDGKFVGVLAIAVDLKNFLSNQFDLLDLNKKLYHLWIVGQDGTLLYPSQHTEMVQRNLFQRDESCRECHASFDYIGKILEGKQGTVDYKLKNSPKRIATFATMEFGETSWVVVLNSSYDEVAAYVRKSLREHLGLLGLVVLTCILVTASVIRIDRLKVQAEEEVKHFGEKKALEDKVRQSETQYRTIVENAHDAIWTLDTHGYITFVNRKGEEISGYKVSELVGKDLRSFISPEDLARAEDLFADILRGKVENFDAGFRTKDGEIRLLSVNVVPIHENGIPVGMASIGRDITEHMNVEKALRESEKQLRYLSSQLLTAQETERRRISRELHDELGQALSVIKLRLGFIEKELRMDQGAAKKECEAISQYINQVIENVRRLSRDLTPSILEDAGLLAAIHWLITNSKASHPIKMVLDVGDIDHSFSPDAQIMIYRVLQEALTNIGRHGRAKKASVMINTHEDEISFCVEDDGVGFDVFQAVTVNPDERGLGLAIMEERARMLRGSLEIWSEKGKGTRITLHVPLKKGGSA